MPKINDEQREERRSQILEAAWNCFHRYGIHSTTMEDIIKESKLSAGAMYRYFKGKDDIIFEAIRGSLTDLGAVLGPVVESESSAGPAEFVGQVVEAIAKYSKRNDFHLSSLAVHGWSEAQRNEAVRVMVRDFYLLFRERVRARVTHWQKAGVVAKNVSPDEMAMTLQSLILGFVVQSAVTRDADPRKQARGLAGLMDSNP
ncbi:TetR/AcrR family transcriptional regulator [Variovorax sp. Sphag1AA]|uniref:TetR/AcrR family transcriptional regulator n=1 Tax=Variovorax sp. Sphag1AA TaxID=2587027 RepID=UPI00160C9E78|nr:TetR/AcrR family transcriptional regulator [Variovorax sp. Sphag1AA]MBB3178748.1 AcrR family transcriptional regulator [Variovorax sp. Sphag1AA]